MVSPLFVVKNIFRGEIIYYFLEKTQNSTGFSITDDSLVTVIEFDDNIPQEIKLTDIQTHVPNFSYTPENRKYSGLFSNVKKIKMTHYQNKSS